MDPSCGYAFEKNNNNQVDPNLMFWTLHSAYDVLASPQAVRQEQHSASCAATCYACIWLIGTFNSVSESALLHMVCVQLITLEICWETSVSMTTSGAESTIISEPGFVVIAGARYTQCLFVWKVHLWRTCAWLMVYVLWHTRTHIRCCIGNARNCQQSCMLERFVHGQGTYQSRTRA